MKFNEEKKKIKWKTKERERKSTRDRRKKEEETKKKTFKRKKRDDDDDEMYVYIYIYMRARGTECATPPSSIRGADFCQVEDAERLSRGVFFASIASKKKTKRFWEAKRRTNFFFTLMHAKRDK
mgnify:CR=1 FL=1